jgi:branched-chain amino acid transport system permease protein
LPYAYSEQYISPNTYNFELTVLFLLAVIMGGRKTRSGALLGAAIIVILPKLLDDLAMFRSIGRGSGCAHAGRRRHRYRQNDHAKAMAIPVVGTIAGWVSFWLHPSPTGV